MGAAALIKRQKRQSARKSGIIGTIFCPRNAGPHVVLAATDGGEVDPVQQNIEIGPRQRNGLASRASRNREQPLLEPPARIQQTPGPKPIIFIIVRRRSSKTNPPPETTSPPSG